MLRCFAVVLLLSCLLKESNGFSASTSRRPRRHVLQSSQQVATTTTSTTSLYSSIDPNDEDELSRLIGKRSEIKRKKKAEEDVVERDTLEFEIDENSIEWDSLPEFKTTRPVRKKKPSSDEQKKKKQQEEKDAGLDFLVDYEDENELHIPNRIGVTTIAWGDPSRNFVPKGKLTKKMRREGKFVPGDLQVAYNQLLENGVSFFETSERYGSASRSSKLSAEDILARCMEEQKTENQPLIATTFSNPFPSFRYGSNAVVKAIEASCARMDTSGIELVQVQAANSLYPGGRRAIANGLSQAVDKGYCNYVGAWNLSKGGMKGMIGKLEPYGLTLTSNQFEFSLTNRKADKRGLIDACKELGVIPLVRNPLDGGLASGRFTATNPSGGEAGGAARFPFEKLEKLQPLHSVQETVAERASTRVKREQRDLNDRYRARYGPAPKINTDITTTQVAINYVIAKGAVPLCEVTDSKQADEILGCLGWSLSEEEVDMLDSAATLCGL